MYISSSLPPCLYSPNSTLFCVSTADFSLFDAIEDDCKSPPLLDDRFFTPPPAPPDLAINVFDEFLLLCVNVLLAGGRVGMRRSASCKRIESISATSGYSEDS